MTRNFDHIDPGNSGGSTIIPELPHIAPAPKKWLCDKCDQEFVDHEVLRQHRLQEHPLKRPTLHIAGLAARMGAYRIRATLSEADLLFGNTENIVIDGQLQSSSMEASRKLAAISRGRVNVELQYESYTAEYDLDIDILSEECAEEIEAKFFESSCNGSAADVLSYFSLATSRINEGKSYVGALQAYLTGLIWRADASAAGPVQGDNMVKLGEALDFLEPIDRPLARGLSCLISFMRNDFSTSKHDGLFPFLADLKRVINGANFPDSPNSGGIGLVNIPIDSVLDKLVLFLYDQDKNRRQEVPVLLGLVESNHLSVGDQIKLRLFLLAWYMKADQLDAAREQYLNLIHRPGLGRYAETLAGGRL